MGKPKVTVIKKKPVRPIPLKGSSIEVAQEIDRYCDEIDKEIDHIRANALKKSYSLTDGVFIYAERKDGYYQFPNYQFLNFAPDTGVEVHINNAKYSGFISYCTHEYIEICIQEYTDPIDSLSMTIDPTKLTRALCNRVKTLDPCNALLRMLVDGGKRSLAKTGSPATGFESARKMVEEGFISMVWGPPGTGKTYTLANLALEYMTRGKRVLIMSQSNISVDGAILKIIDIADKEGTKNKLNGKVFRYGMAREPNLYADEDFCVRLYAKNQDPVIKKILSQVDEVLHLKEENKSVHVAEKLLSDAIQKLLSRSDVDNTTKDVLKDNLLTFKTKICPLDWLKKRAQRIRAICHEILVIAEESYIRKASIVATTATKAIITDKIKDMSWDIVFFDEVSMAFVPQIMVAATLARERLVLLGDFRQLAPIVQFSPESILRKDIFSYLHATDGKGSVTNHPWLTMLDEQHRMHPDIASFVSASIYSNKLRTAPDVKENVLGITNNVPFESKVFALVDHSEYQALCYTTVSGSRYNPFSAMVSVRLALKALEKTNISIGIITPYQAQARLLAAMVKDAEIARNRKLDILCSTVHQFQGFEKDLIIFDAVESEPKRGAGKLFVDGDYVDDATRLVNVAVTRARGKFIMVANYNYLKSHTYDISEEMRKLLETCKTSHRFHWKDLLDFLSEKDKKNNVCCYKTEADALLEFLGSLRNGNKEKKLTYWHSSRNILSTQSLAGSSFLEKMKESKEYWSSVGGFNGKGTKMPFITKAIFPDFNPTDDYLVGEDTFVWFGIPSCQNNNYGKRLPYIIKGKNATSVFEILCAHETARKEWQKHKKNLKMGDYRGTFKTPYSGFPDCMKNA